MEREAVVRDTEDLGFVGRRKKEEKKKRKRREEEEEKGDAGDGERGGDNSKLRPGWFPK